LNQDDISNSDSDLESEEEDIKIKIDNASPSFKKVNKKKNKSRKTSPE
jgi:hypothetical protein